MKIIQLLIFNHLLTNKLYFCILFSILFLNFLIYNILKVFQFLKNDIKCIHIFCTRVHIIVCITIKQIKVCQI